MADTIHLDLVTPNKRLVEADVGELTAKAVQGQVQLLPGHANYITVLDAGELTFTLAGKKKHVAVTGGFAEVTLDQGIRIMAEAAEYAEDIDIERAKAAQARAEKRISDFDRATQAADIARAERALKRAQARLAVAEKISNN